MLLLLLHNAMQQLTCLAATSVTELHQRFPVDVAHCQMAELRDGLSLELRHVPGSGAQQGHKVPIHLKLLLMDREVVDVVTEGHLELASYEVNAREAHNPDKGGDHGGPDLRRPQAHDDRRDQHVNENQGSRHLRIGKGEGHDHDLQSVAEAQDTLTQLREDAAGDGRGHGEGAVRHQPEHIKLDPVRYELHLLLLRAVTQRCKLLLAKAANVDQREMLVLRPRNCLQSHCMQQREQPHHRLLEPGALPGRPARHGTVLLADPREGDAQRASLEPHRLHVVHCAGGRPEASVGLRSAEHQGEAEDETEAAVDGAVLDKGRL
mmetsp:Transcript_130706/g.279511  ORF Transcript_130706/g.279511 Transcript_130706/m.279511 type:complete len:321 (-) Transcript_130706:239-1201(-)